MVLPAMPGGLQEMVPSQLWDCLEHCSAFSNQIMVLIFLFFVFFGHVDQAGFESLIYHRAWPYEVFLFMLK